MSKFHVYPIEQTIAIPSYNRVRAGEETNPESKNGRDLRDSFRFNGIQESKVLEGTTITDAQIGEGQAYLADLMLRVKKSASSDEAKVSVYYTVLSTVLQTVFGTGDAKKPFHKPKVLIRTGNRRWLCSLYAIADICIDWMAEKEFTDPAKVTPEVVRNLMAEHSLQEWRVLVLDGLSDLDITLHQFEENATQVGVEKMQPTFMVELAAELIQAGANQSKVRDKLKDGTGKKVFALAAAHLRFPQLDVVNRLKLPTSDPNHIPFGRIGQNNFAMMINALDGDYVKKINKRADRKDNPISKSTEELIADYLRNPWSEGMTRPEEGAEGSESERKKFTKTPKELEGMNLSANEVVRTFASHMTGDATNEIARINTLAVPMNAILHIGKNETLEIVLQQLEELQQADPNKFVECVGEIARLMKSYAVEPAKAKTTPAKAKKGKVETEQEANA